MFILMVILKHISWFSLPSECLTAGYLLSILYSLNGCEGILSYSLHKYTKITNGKRIHVYIMLCNLFLYVTIALSILYSVNGLLLHSISSNVISRNYIHSSNFDSTYLYIEAIKRTVQTCYALFREYKKFVKQTMLCRISNFISQHKYL